MHLWIYRIFNIVFSVGSSFLVQFIRWVSLITTSTSVTPIHWFHKHDVEREAGHSIEGESTVGYENEQDFTRTEVALEQNPGGTKLQKQWRQECFRGHCAKHRECDGCWESSRLHRAAKVHTMVRANETWRALKNCCVEKLVNSGTEKYWKWRKGWGWIHLLLVVFVFVCFWSTWPKLKLSRRRNPNETTPPSKLSVDFFLD